MKNAALRTLILGAVETNCYILINKEDNEAIVFDPADSPDRIYEELERFEAKCVAICLTHGHFDHILAAGDLAKKTGSKIYASRREEKVLGSATLNCSASMMLRGRSAVTVSADVWLEDNQKIELAGFGVECLSTPGHTEGSCCYYIKEMSLLFSGDTLFEGSVGRTDLPTGSMGTLIRSIEDKLLRLPDDTKVFSGHGGPTSIGDEKKYNPFLRHL